MKKYDTSRVNMNLPTKLVKRVKDYASEMGVPDTQAYVMLLNFGFQYADLPKQIDTFNQMLEVVKKSDIEVLE